MKRTCHLMGFTILADHWQKIKGSVLVKLGFLRPSCKSNLGKELWTPLSSFGLSRTPTKIALLLNNPQKVDMPLNKETIPDL